MDLQAIKAKAARFGAKAAAMATTVALCAATSVPALAADGEASVTTIVSAADTVTSMTSKVFSMIAGNGLLSVYAASGLVGVGVLTFKRLKKASR